MTHLCRILDSCSLWCEILPQILDVELSSDSNVEISYSWNNGAVIPIINILFALVTLCTGDFKMYETQWFYKMIDRIFLPMVEKMWTISKNVCTRARIEKYSILYNDFIRWLYNKNYCSIISKNDCTILIFFNDYGMAITLVY